MGHKFKEHEVDSTKLPEVAASRSTAIKREVAEEAADGRVDFDKVKDALTAEANQHSAALLLKRCGVTAEDLEKMVDMDESMVVPASAKKKKKSKH